MLTRFQQDAARFGTPAADYLVGYLVGAWNECQRENPDRPFRLRGSRGNRLFSLALDAVAATTTLRLPAPDPSRAARVANARLRLRMAIDRQQRAETIEEFLADADAMERAQRELRELGAQHEADAVFALFDPSAAEAMDEARADELESADRDDSDAAIARRSGISADDTVDSRGRPLRPRVNDAGEPYWM